MIPARDPAAGAVALVVLDFETTGLIPDTEFNSATRIATADWSDRVPLECAAVVTDWDFRIIEAREWLIAHENLKELVAGCHERVYAMHTENGLWRDLLAEKPPKPRIALGQLDDYLCDLATPWDPRNKPLLAGFTCSFDREFLKVYAPKFAKKIHYRDFNVSTIREWAKVVYPNWGPGNDPPAHRAIDDCLAPIKYAKWFRQHVMVPYHRADG